MDCSEYRIGDDVEPVRDASGNPSSQLRWNQPDAGIRVNLHHAGGGVRQLTLVMAV